MDFKHLKSVFLSIRSSTDDCETLRIQLVIRILSPHYIQGTLILKEIAWIIDKHEESLGWTQTSKLFPIDKGPVIFPGNWTFMSRMNFGALVLIQDS